MIKKVNILYFLAVCHGLFRGFSIILTLLLPIFYAEKVIPIIYIGYLGAIHSAGVLAGSSLLNVFGNKFRKIDFINFASGVALVSFLSLIFFKSNLSLFIIYLVSGVCYGLVAPFFQAFKGEHTSTENRIRTFASLDVISDFFKIAHPIISFFVYAKFGINGLLYFLVITALVYFVSLFLFETHTDHKHEVMSGQEKVSFNFKLINNNKFNLFLLLEFIDSVASQALFLFIPTLFLVKHFTIENTLIFQATVYFGYLSGRLFVSKLSGIFGVKRGLMYAFLGQAVTLFLLVITPANPILFVFCYLLGLFGRGTTPVINGSALNQLDNVDFKRGSSLYGISGEIGAICSQFFMGLTLAYLGAEYPFYFSIFICAIVIFIIERYLD